MTPKFLKLNNISEFNYNWKRKWQPTPVSLPGESHGQRQTTVHGVAGVGNNLATKIELN